MGLRWSAFPAAPPLGTQGHKLLEHLQYVCVQVGCEKQRLQCAAVLLNLFMMLQEKLQGLLKGQTIQRKDLLP